MSRTLPSYRGPGTPPSLRWLLGVSLVLHLGIISEFPTRTATAIPAEKPKPVLHFALKPPPPGARPAPKPPPPKPAEMKKPADKKEAPRDAAKPPPSKPEEKKKEEKPTPQPSIAPPMQKVRLGGAKDHESNQKDKGALPSAQKAEAAEAGKGMRPKEEGPEMIAKQAPAAEAPRSPPPPEAPKKEDSPPPKLPPPPRKEEEKKARREDPPPLEKEAKIAKKENAPGEEILQRMGGRPVRSVAPPTRKKRRDMTESEKLLAQIRERNPEFLQEAQREPAPPPRPQGVQTSRFVPQGNATRGANADPFSDVQGFIPLSQALTKLSRGGPVPRIMPDGVTSNIASDGTMGMSEFREMLLEHLRRYKVWPEGFEALGIQGKAYVSCRIDGFTGELIDYRIWRSSGHAEIDQAAVSTLKRSSPFPPIGTPGTLYLDLVLQYDDQELQGI